MFRQDEQRPMTSQFAVRVAVLGGIALVAFAVIFFRLWYLEILSGEEYRAAADSNRVREITIQAPRGEILDREGRVLVKNRTALSLQVRPDQLPDRPAARNRVLRRLAGVTDSSATRIRRQIRRQQAELPASPVTLERDVDRKLVYYLREHQDRFPGVSAEEVYVRDYPNGTLGAHLFGFVSEIGPDQLEEPQYEGLEMGDRIGATGIEAQYDRALRGRNGAVRVQVDAFGQPRGRSLSEVEPEKGDSVVLTLDKKLQQAGEEAISQFGKPASFVAMDPRDGEILAMGSVPAFDPGIYTPPVSFGEIDRLQNAEGDPLFNKAIQSAYPTGSTFKLVTATAALEEGLITPTTTISDSGSINFGGLDWENAGGHAYGSVDMTRALQVSSNVYFFLLGLDSARAGGEPIQKWASQLGFGSTTGIDLPGEGPGLLPTPEWRNELYEDGNTDRPWSEGDMMNLAVGQGDLGATPLQLAVAYATVANGGSVPRPHLGHKVENTLGQTVQEIDPAARRETDLSPETQGVIAEGLRRAAMESGGTSAGVFGGFPVDLAGKTGTGETSSGEDQSWYAAWMPVDKPRIVVTATIEGGGFGAESAAPAVREILEEYLLQSGDFRAKDFGDAGEGQVAPLD
jgi:penicillin-binding protein 2